MVVTLVRLQLALRRRAVGFTGLTQRALFLLRWLAGVGFGLAGASLMAAADWLRPSAGTLPVAALGTAVWLGWILLPLTAPAIAGVGLDPRRLIGYPVRTVEHLVAAVIGSLIGPAGLATFLTAAGVVVASTERWQSRLIVLPAAILFTLVCVTSSLAVRGLVDQFGLRRPARVAAALLSVVLVLWTGIAAEQAGGLAPLAARLGGGGWDTALGVLPGGSAADLTEALRGRRWIPGGLAVTDLVLLGVLSCWLVLWCVGRWVDVPPARLGRANAGPSQLRMLPFPLNLGRPGPVMAAAGQQLRYLFFRSPLGVRAVLLVPVLGLVVATATAGAFSVPAGTAALALIAVPTTLFNVFGLDADGALWLVRSGAPLRSVLAGKLLAGLTIIGPFLAAFVVLHCLLAGAWEDSLLALVLGLAVYLVGIGLGALTSVLGPYDLTRLPRAGLLRALALGVGALVLQVGATGAGALALVLLSDRRPQLVLATGLLVVALVVAAVGIVIAGLLVRGGSRIERAVDPSADVA